MLLGYLCSKSFIIPRIILLMMIPIHETIKPRTIRTVVDLIYWPDGICVDTILVYVFLVVFICSTVNDYIHVKKIIVDNIKENWRV